MTNSTDIINILAPLTPLGAHIVAVFAGVVGLLMIFFGQKLLKTCMFALGFAGGFTFGAVITNKFNGFENIVVTPHIMLIAAVSGGVVVGGFAAFLVTITKICLAVACGVAVSFAVAQSGMTTTNEYVFWAVAAVAFLIMLWAAFKVFDHAVVIVTSLVGSMAVIFSVANFIPSLSFSLAQLLNDPTTVKGCSKNQDCEALLVAWGVLVCLGLYVQFKRLDNCTCGDKQNKERRESEIALLSM